MGWSKCKDAKSKDDISYNKGYDLANTKRSPYGERFPQPFHPKSEPAQAPIVYKTIPIFVKRANLSLQSKDGHRSRGSNPLFIDQEQNHPLRRGKVDGLHEDYSRQFHNPSPRLGTVSKKGERKNGTEHLKQGLRSNDLKTSPSTLQNNLLPRNLRVKSRLDSYNSR